MIQKNKWISHLADGVLSGIMIGIGAVVLLSSDNRYLGAFLFSLGLFCIIRFQYALFTGKVGYLVYHKFSYTLETFYILLANAIGTGVVAGGMRLTRFADGIVPGAIGSTVTIVSRAEAMMLTKLSDTPISSFLLAVFCGILMFSAVEAYRKCSAENNFTGAVFGVVMPVFVFIICGFNHCVADAAYYFLAGMPDWQNAVIYFPVVILGNTVGGVLVPLLKKCSNQPL